MKKQNVILKVGIGLALGFGAIAFAPKAAQASTPCTPQLPPNEICQFPETTCKPEAIGPGLPDGCYYTNAQDCLGLGAYNKQVNFYECTASTDQGPVVFDCQETIYIFITTCYVV